MTTRRIIYVPSPGSSYSGFLSGICYIDGKPVTEEEYRSYCIKAALEKAQEIGHEG